MKISKIFLKVLMLVMIIQFWIAAPTVRADFWHEVITAGDNFLNEGASSSIASPSDTDVQQVVTDVYNILFPLGVVITVAVGGILGINFMLASAENKAKVKESLVPYAIGCAVIYGAFGIWRLCIAIFSVLG